MTIKMMMTVMESLSLKRQSAYFAIIFCSIS